MARVVRVWCGGEGVVWWRGRDGDGAGDEDVVVRVLVDGVVARSVCNAARSLRAGWRG